MSHRQKNQHKSRHRTHAQKPARPFCAADPVKGQTVAKTLKAADVQPSTYVAKVSET